jgi:hypothetical protein
LIVEEDMKKNRQIAELVKSYKQNVSFPPPPVNTNPSLKLKDSKGTPDSKTAK